MLKDADEPVAISTSRKKKPRNKFMPAVVWVQLLRDGDDWCIGRPPALYNYIPSILLLSWVFPDAPEFHPPHVRTPRCARARRTPRVVSLNGLGYLAGGGGSDGGHQTRQRSLPKHYYYCLVLFSITTFRAHCGGKAGAHELMRGRHGISMLVPP
jgi:hypothetical protein